MWNYWFSEAPPKKDSITNLLGFWSPPTLFHSNKQIKGEKVQVEKVFFVSVVTVWLLHQHSIWSQKFYSSVTPASPPLWYTNKMRKKVNCRICFHVVNTWHQQSRERYTSNPSALPISRQCMHQTIWYISLFTLSPVCVDCWLLWQHSHDLHHTLDLSYLWQWSPSCSNQELQDIIHFGRVRHVCLNHRVEEVQLVAILGTHHHALPGPHQVLIST